MGVFDQMHILTAGEDEEESGLDLDLVTDSLVVAEVGCKTENIVRQTMTAGVTMPLRARPSVSAEL